VASDPARRLILLRHAKSDWPDVPDAERPLARRGRRDAPRIGRWLHDQGYQPDVVICSTALRTRQTWELVSAGLAGARSSGPVLDGPVLDGPEPGSSPAVRFEPRAYAASPLALRFLIQELPARYHAALLIAHNPGLAELAGSLAQAGLSFPTAAVAVFELAGGWADLWPAQVRLIAVTTPAALS
jgi:phosphohistidine phosphatase